MFVLHELDKLLKSVAGRPDAKDNDIKVTLADVPRINVTTLELAKRVNFRPPIIKPVDLKSKSQLSTTLRDKDPDSLLDGLLVTLLEQQVLARIALMPERPYPTARLLICDRQAHELVSKLARLMPAEHLYRHPLSLSAILSLEDVAAEFSRQKEPMILVQNKTAVFNYALIKRIIPYIKLADITVLISDRLERFSLKSDSSDVQCVVEILVKYSRSCQIVELQLPIGHPHQLFANVTLVRPQLSAEIASAKLPLARLPPAYLSVMAERVAYIAERLNLRIGAIIQRAADPSGQTRLFSRLLSTGCERVSGSGRKFAKVLVLDRLFDLRGPLYHATRYGALLEQETLVAGTERFVDELDERLQLEPLLDLLGAIIRYTGQSKSVASVNARTSATRRHLNKVKLIYKVLNDGYLLIARLEASLESTCRQIAEGSGELKSKILTSLERISMAFLELVSGRLSLDAMDLVRFSCLFLDSVNCFTYHFGQEARVTALKSSLIGSKTLKSKTSGVALDKLLGGFDQYSQNSMPHRCKFSLVQIIRSVCSGENLNLFEVVNLANKNEANANKLGTLVVVLLGLVSSDELSRVKMLELELRQTNKSFSVLVVVPGVARPDEFVNAI